MFVQYRIVCTLVSGSTGCLVLVDLAFFSLPVKICLIILDRMHHIIISQSAQISLKCSSLKACICQVHDFSWEHFASTITLHFKPLMFLKYTFADWTKQLWLVSWIFLTKTNCLVIEEPTHFHIFHQMLKTWQADKTEPLGGPTCGNFKRLHTLCHSGISSPCWLKWWPVLLPVTKCNGSLWPSQIVYLLCGTIAV